MPAKTSRTPAEIYELKVTLIGSRPPIWRRIQVPGNLTLDKLHMVLQMAMGWTDSHLHDFRVGRERFGPKDPEDDCFDERKVRIGELLARKGARMVYSYDFGDGWEHSIVLEKVLAPEPGVAYPVCIDGKRHCPPEDCGGIGGYEALLETLADPQHEDHESMMEWLGGGFEPEEFSVEEVNQYLQPRRVSKKK